MSMSVLIADADPLLLSAYRAYLLEGVEVRTATSGLTCLEELRRWRPDVLVLDADLPWGSGLGVLAVMRDDPTLPLIPVLLLTARPADLAEQIIPIRDYALLIKPIPPVVMAGLIFALADSGWWDRNDMPESGLPTSFPVPARVRRNGFGVQSL